MIFRQLPLSGAYLIEPEKKEDERGFFARVICLEEFRAHSLKTEFIQSNISYNRRAGTLRGMHYQLPPHAEVKLIKCINGAIYDAIIDLRPDSPTYRQWIGVELSAKNRTMLYVPEGFAHGYQALKDDTEVLYMVTAAYAPHAERGVRFDAFPITWPLEISFISAKDEAIRTASNL